MADDTKYTKKLFLRLRSDGFIEIDDDYFWDGCDTPEIDPEIELTPVALSKLAQLTADLNLCEVEKADIERLKKLLAELKTSSDIINAAINKIEAKFP